jgi:germination protein M
MNRQPRGSRPRSPLSVAWTLSLTLVMAACTAISGDLGPVATPLPTTGASADVPAASGALASASPTSSDAGTIPVRAYFFLGSFTGNAGLVPVVRQVPKTQAVGAAAMAALIAGPNSTELGARPAMYTSVPSDTRFLGVTVTNGVALVNLSSEFQAGGDTASIVGRFAQVVYTLTQFPTVRSVSFEFDGVRPKTVFIGVYTRSNYTSMLPAIFVDRPSWGGILPNPARIAGLANVFEATFRVAILDASGAVLVDVPASALCGTGCWGTFDTTIPYALSASNAATGTLRVYDLSAKDGSREHVTDYPVFLTP